MVDKIIIDADLCIKLGGSNKYRYLYDVLPLIAKEIYMHTHAHGEVMIDPTRPNKNKGEMCSLAYAKATGIPVFATDEKNLQPIIDKRLNTGMDDITCIRIVDIITKAKDGEIVLPRKIAKALWLVAGKKKDIFDNEIWPVIIE